MIFYEKDEKRGNKNLPHGATLASVAPCNKVEEKAKKIAHKDVRINAKREAKLLVRRKNPRMDFFF